MVKISAALPTHMKAVVLKDYDGTPQSVAAADFSVPRLRSGQVLIKLAATSIGPADLMFLKGQYGITKPLPVAPGFEGSGTVIASGGGWLGWGLVGKPVACLALEDGHGTWAEYMVTSADLCIPLFKHTSFEQGACLTRQLHREFSVEEFGELSYFNLTVWCLGSGFTPVPLAAIRTPDCASTPPEDRQSAVCLSPLSSVLASSTTISYSDVV